MNGDPDAMDYEEEVKTVVNEKAKGSTITILDHS
jgi:hypothetical protein